MKRFLAGAFSLLLALGAGIRIWYVNTHVDPRFTPPETEVYQMGEWVELEGNFQFSAHSVLGKGPAPAAGHVYRMPRG